MEIYSLFIDGILYGLYRNREDAYSDCEAVRRMQTTHSSMVKQHTLLEAPMHDKNVGNITEKSEAEIKWENTETLILVKNGNLDGLKYVEKIGRVNIYRNPNIIKTAVEYGCLDIVKYAGPKSTRTANYSALQISLDKGDLEIFKFLLKHLEYNIHRKLSFDIAIKCVKNNYREIIKYMFENMDNIKFQSTIPLIITEAISAHNVEMQQFIKSLGIKEEMMIDLYKEQLLEKEKQKNEEMIKRINDINRNHNEYHKIMDDFESKKQDLIISTKSSKWEQWEKAEKMAREKDPKIGELIKDKHITANDVFRIVCKNDYLEMVQRLLPTVDKRDKRIILDCLSSAIVEGHLNIIKCILEYLKFNINDVLIKILASQCEKPNNENLVEYIVSIPNNLLREKIVSELISVCIKNENIKILTYLANLGVDIKTALTIESADMLLNRLGIYPQKEEIKKEPQKDPILIAVENGDVPRFSQLLNDIDLNEEIIKNILKIAVENNRVNIMEHLESIGIEIRDHPTLLNIALFVGNNAMVQYLLSIGFNSGNAFLYYANIGDIGMMEWIIKNIGKDRVGIRNIENSMKTAIENKSESVIKFLELVLNY